jgi:hypothetical protein
MGTGSSTWLVMLKTATLWKYRTRFDSPLPNECVSKLHVTPEPAYLSKVQANSCINGNGCTYRQINKAIVHCAIQLDIPDILQLMQATK